MVLSVAHTSGQGFTTPRRLAALGGLDQRPAHRLPHHQSKMRVFLLILLVGATLLKVAATEEVKVATEEAKVEETRGEGGGDEKGEGGSAGDYSGGEEGV
ncbi:hypothetical protein O3P69_005513 [Scylla paramamosain]|uniref:Uncharacterized protein n=1 Tax=Scylla paramamosain TaxID=85552 RepID=A0AAW0UBC6_SCYPA